MIAEKVDGFPQPVGPGKGTLKYPFKMIADDGGIWRLTPCADGNCRAITSAAWQWAKSHGYTSTVQTHNGCVYLQFATALQQTED